MENKNTQIKYCRHCGRKIDGYFAYLNVLTSVFYCSRCIHFTSVKKVKGEN